MCSDRRSRRLAVVLRGSGCRGAVVDREGRELVEELLLRDDPRRLPRAPIVLVAARPDEQSVERVSRLSRRYRDRLWLAVSRDPELRAGWTRLPGGALPAPLSRETLVCLARQARELSSWRRRSQLAGGRVDSLEERLVLLSDTIQAAGSLLDPGMVSRFIMERAAERIGTCRWRLYRIDEVSSMLRLDAWCDEDEKPSPEAAIPLEQGLAGEVARRRRVMHLAGKAARRSDPGAVEWPLRPPRWLLAVPLVSRGRVIGVAQFADPDEGDFSARDIETVQTLMEPAAIALDNAQLFRKLEERTVTDDLTALYNARFMENYLRRETKRAERYGHPVAMLFIDLDGFKQVNDVHGHMAGSRTLVEVGQVLRENVREIDVVARWGGDEFAVVLPETDGEGARVMADRLCQKIRERRFLEELGLDVRISASIGVSSWPENGPTWASLLAAADAAMYRVKNSGKDGVHVALEEEKTLLAPA